MRISYISTYPPALCGIATYTHYLTKSLLKIDREIKIFVIAERGASEIKTERLEVKVCFEREKDYVGKITPVLKDTLPEVVHIQHEFAIFNPDQRFLNLLQEIRKRAKIVVTLHTVHTNATSDWEGMSMSMEEYNRKIGKLTHTIVVHQDSMKKSLSSQGIPENLIHVIPHGTEILKKVDKKEARKRLNLPEDGKIILSFGFFSKYKNRDLVIEALPYVLDRVQNAYLLFSGYPRKEAKKEVDACVKKAEKLGVKDRVILMKRFVPDEEIHLVFGASDVVVFPYFQKYFSASGSLHLAIGAFKIPVVSNIPKFEEVPQNISEELTFEPKNPSDLARILVKVLKDENFRKAAVEKVKNYALETSWDEVAKKHLQIYRAL